MLNIKINGIDRTSNLVEGSLSIGEAVNERSVASISLVDTNGLYRPTVGEVVEITDAKTWGSLSKTWGVLVEEQWIDYFRFCFSGTIDDLPEQQIEGTGVLVFNNIPVVDFHQSADRRLVAEAYENVTAGFIVNQLLTLYLADEGIVAGNIQTGATIQKAVFNYRTVSQCLDELCEITGLQWRINPDKSLDFFNRATFTGTPVNEQFPYRNLKIKKTRQQYRNRQFLRAGQDISQVQTRTFKGDGETQVFTVELPIATVPTIKVNGVTKTVGIRGLETGFDWYWQKNDKTISQEETATKLLATDVLTVQFQGFYPIIVVAENTSGITDRQLVEGGTGIYESIEEKNSIDTKESALAYSQGLLRRFSDIKLQVSFDSYDPFVAGQLVAVDLPSHSISEQMLVAEVKVSDTGARDNRLNYSVRLVSGESFGGWTNFFKKLAEQNKTFVIRENEIVIKLSSFSDQFTQPKLSDTMTYSVHQYKLCSTVLKCGEGVII